jgi:hypothetical protein
MKKTINRKILVSIAVLMLVAAGAFAQTAQHTVTITIADFGVIALNSIADIPFATSAPVLPGDPVSPLPASPATDISKSLFYTTSNLATKTRHITVQSNVNPPAGTALTVNAAVAAGAGANAGPATISSAAAVDLVTGIGSVATGRAAGNGASLTYSFWVSNPALLVVGGAPTVVTVTYTMTADTF